MTLSFGPCRPIESTRPSDAENVTADTQVADEGRNDPMRCWQEYNLQKSKILRSRVGKSPCEVIGLKSQIAASMGMALRNDVVLVETTSQGCWE